MLMTYELSFVVLIELKHALPVEVADKILTTSRWTFSSAHALVD